MEEVAPFSGEWAFESCLAQVRVKERQVAFPREETTHAEVDYQKRAWGVCGLGKAEKVGLGEAGEWLELEGGWTAKGQVKVLREFGLLSNDGVEWFCSAGAGRALWQEGGGLAGERADAR